MFHILVACVGNNEFHSWTQKLSFVLVFLLFKLLFYPIKAFLCPEWIGWVQLAQRQLFWNGVLLVTGLGTRKHCSVRSE